VGQDLHRPREDYKVYLTAALDEREFLRGLDALPLLHIGRDFVDELVGDFHQRDAHLLALNKNRLPLVLQVIFFAQQVNRAAQPRHAHILPQVHHRQVGAGGRVDDASNRACNRRVVVMHIERAHVDAN
jgi:hypothetical protein